MSEPERIPVVVVGGGQAGLAMSWQLTDDGIEHVVLERDTIAHEWRDSRWDSFCLVTPNWQCRLPGYAYAGADPDGFMVKAEVNDWLAGYVASFDPPVREHTAVLSVRQNDDGTFDVRTSGGHIVAEQVVVATGGYHRPKVPPESFRLPPNLVQVHSSQYTGPDQLPDGPVLVVGTGQSGCQIAEDLHLTGRSVHLAVGGAPRVARRYRGRDVVAWLQDMGHYDRPVTDKPIEERFVDRTNHYVTGRDGGHDLDLRVFATEGMQLHGHLVEVQPDELSFAADLGASLDAADAVDDGIKDAIDSFVATTGADAPVEARTPRAWVPPDTPPESLDPRTLAAVVWSTGFRSDYRWLEIGVFDGAGHARHVRGVTAVPGLYFLGLPWLHTWGSGRFAGVARDAEYLADAVRAHGVESRPGLVRAVG